MDREFYMTSEQAEALAGIVCTTEVTSIEIHPYSGTMTVSCDRMTVAMINRAGERTY